MVLKAIFSSSKSVIVYRYGTDYTVYLSSLGYHVHMQYERKNIQQMAGYLPGEQPTDAHTIKLNTNENPYPPPAAVMAALGEVQPEDLRRYPSPAAAGFRDAAARCHGVSSEQIVTTNGGDELIRLALTTFVEPGQPVGIADPSYSLYLTAAAIHGSPVIKANLTDHWQLPTDFAQQMNAAGVALTLVVNPHAPSGQLLTKANIAALADALDGVLMVDEAYVDFADPHHNIVPLIEQHSNLLILRTLSKGYSLAGLRLGYGIGPTNLITPIATKTRDSFSVDAIADRVGATALAHRESFSAGWSMVRENRGKLVGELRKRGFTVPDSQTNFCLARVPNQATQSAHALYLALKEAGILVRYFDTPTLNDCLRITIGTAEQNARLLAAIDAASHE